MGYHKFLCSRLAPGKSNKTKSDLLFKPDWENTRLPSDQILLDVRVTKGSVCYRVGHWGYITSPWAYCMPIIEGDSFTILRLLWPISLAQLIQMSIWCSLCCCVREGTTLAPRLNSVTFLKAVWWNRHWASSHWTGCANGVIDLALVLLYTVNYIM